MVIYLLSLNEHEDFLNAPLHCESCGRRIEAREHYFSNTLGVEFFNKQGEGECGVETVESMVWETLCLECAQKRHPGFMETVRERVLEKNRASEKPEEKNSIMTEEFEPETEKPEYNAERGKCLADEIVPRFSMEDTVLTSTTRGQLELAFAHAENNQKIMGEWGFGKKFKYGTALAINFFGPPGTGKTLCAEALAGRIGKRLLVVNPQKVFSHWSGRTEKNIAAVFRLAAKRNAVLFFDEADTFASKRTQITYSGDAHHNSETNTLLQQLEKFNGTVIFASNFPLNCDPAFERRVSLHVFFEKPGKKERAELFRKLVPKTLPTTPEVNFEELAKEELVGGDIKNIVINAARIALKEKAEKVSQTHFQQAIEITKRNKQAMGTMEHKEERFEIESFVA